MKKSSSISIDEKKWEELESKGTELNLSKNQIISKLVDDFLYGSDLTETKSNKELLDEARIRKLKNENDLASIKKRKLEAETKILEYHARHIETVGFSPSSKAKAAMTSLVAKDGISQVQLRDPIPNFWIDKIANNKFNSHCKLCSTVFDACENYNEAQGDIEAHLEISHNRGLYQENNSI